MNNPKGIIVIIAILLAVVIPAGASHVDMRVARLLSGEILQQAEKNLTEEPVTVTATKAIRSAGGIHDFYSEGDYWWPDPKNPDGPYIRRDGQTNPDNFTAHRHAMVRLSQIVGNLTSAYLLTNDQRYIDAIVSHLKAWFINPQTLMNPHLLYGQAIKGVVTGRGIGIIADRGGPIGVAAAPDRCASSKLF